MQAELFTTSALLPDIIKHNESPKVTSATIIRTRETWELFWGLTKQPTFRKATTHSVFPAKCRLKKERRNFILVTCHHPDLESAPYWLKQIPLRDARPEVVLRSGKWKVISMEFLRSFLRRHIAGKRVTECGVVKWVLFLRLQVSTHESNMSSNKSGCYRLQQNQFVMCFVPTQESEVTPPARQIWVVCALTVT